MWGLIVRCNNRRISKVVGRRLVATSCSGWAYGDQKQIPSGSITTRNFSSRKSRQVVEDVEQMDLEKTQAEALSAADMEFFNQFADDGFDDDDGDDDDEGALFDKEYRRKQEEIQRELDSRTGRPWTDPWEISEEQWMNSTTSMDDLPDWSPEFVSRISQVCICLFPCTDSIIF